MNSDSEDELLYTPPEIRQVANVTIQNLLPKKSKNKYSVVYKNCQDWCSSKNIKSLFTENVLLAYFNELSGRYRASSLWTFYSMLRSTLDINNGINIENYLKLLAFLKRQSEKHVAKKAKTFTPEQLNNFINEAPDEKYQATKVALIMGIMGACHVAEFYSMQITDLEDHGSICMVSVLNTKTKIARKFTVTLDPGAGHLITFLQFLFIALHGFIFTSKFGTVPPKIPLKEYIILVAFFFVTSVVNNWAFDFNIPIPLHFIFRAGSLIANMIMGVLILKKKYTWDKYLSVFMITSGITVCTLYSSKEVGKSCHDCDIKGNMPTDSQQQSEVVDVNQFFWWVIGILLLTAALLLSARMGIYQETLYKVHGKHPDEALYYTHLYSLPGFLLYAGSIWNHSLMALKSDPVQMPFSNFVIPIIWVYLMLNVLTQYMCISSVYVLTTECSSLTVTLVITLRKFLSLVFSIIYFQNPFTLAHWFGTLLVFGGTLLFSEVPKRISLSLKDKSKKSN